MKVSLEEIFARKRIITLARGLASRTEGDLSIRQLALRTGLSPSEASTVIRNMKDLGIVRLSSIGKAVVVSLNEKSYIWQKILKPLLEAEEGMRKEPAPIDSIVIWLKKRLRKEGNKIISAAVYGNLALSVGSYAFSMFIKKCMMEMD